MSGTFVGAEEVSVMGGSAATFKEVGRGLDLGLAWTVVRTGANASIPERRGKKRTKSFIIGILSIL